MYIYLHVFLRYLVVVEPTPKKQIVENEQGIPVAVDSSALGDKQEDISTTGEDATNGDLKRKNEWQQKKKGQNKVRNINNSIYVLYLNIQTWLQSRKAVFKTLKGENLCKAYFDGPNPSKPCIYANCRFQHDVVQYMADKPKDISETCYIYSTRGFCIRGITCRAAGAHLDSSFNNVSNEELRGKQDLADAKWRTTNTLKFGKF